MTYDNRPHSHRQASPKVPAAMDIMGYSGDIAVTGYRRIMKECNKAKLCLRFMKNCAGANERICPILYNLVNSNKSRLLKVERKNLKGSYGKQTSNE